jgi:hypothetical protein
MTSKRLFSLVLAAVMSTSSIIPASATTISTSGESGTVPVTLTAEAAVFDVEVPTTLPINVDGSGVVTTASNMLITNYGHGAVKVKNVEISAKNGWSTVDYDSADMSAELVNSKKVAFAITGSESVYQSMCDAKDAITNLENTSSTLNDIEYRIADIEELIMTWEFIMDTTGSEDDPDYISARTERDKLKLQKEELIASRDDAQNILDNYDSNMDAAVLNMQSVIGSDTSASKTTGNNTISFSASDYSVLYGVVQPVPAQGSNSVLTKQGTCMPLTYYAKVPAQTSSISSTVVANVIFTIAWDTES